MYRNITLDLILDLKAIRKFFILGMIKPLTSIFTHLMCFNDVILLVARGYKGQDM